MAAYLTTVRAAGDLDMTPCICLSGIVATLIAWPLAQPWMVPPEGAPYLALLCIVVIPLSFSLITIGPRYLPAHEVSLIGALETFLGPLWVWLALGENRTGFTRGRVAEAGQRAHSSSTPRAAPG